jgi:hypothetical protein
MLLSGDSNNPILHVEELPRWPWHRPRAVPGAVHVYLSRSDVLSEPRGGLTLGELWWHGPSRLYIVDRNAHPVDISREVVSRSTGLTTSVEVSCTWRVTEAVKVVEAGLVDVTVLLPPLLSHVLDTALATAEWDTPEALARALRSDLLPAQVTAYGIEVSGLRTVVVSVPDAEPAPRDGDDD